MLQIISGAKGKGKTKIMLDKVTSDINNAKGSILYLDKDDKHIYELNNKIRLINVSDFGLNEAGEFIGFICGIISQDHDIEKMYLDSFLSLACTNKEELALVIDKLDIISTKYEVDFVISVSLNECDLSESTKRFVVVSL